LGDGKRNKGITIMHKGYGKDNDWSWKPREPGCKRGEVTSIF